MYEINSVKTEIKIILLFCRTRISFWKSTLLWSRCYWFNISIPVHKEQYIFCVSWLYDSHGRPICQEAWNFRTAFIDLFGATYVELELACSCLGFGLSASVVSTFRFTPGRAPATYDRRNMLKKNHARLGAACWSESDHDAVPSRCSKYG